MSDPILPPYTGLALFSYGFRPLFLLAGAFAALVVPLWMGVWSGNVVLDGPFSTLDWHIHEMLFGYTSAVIAGFLFTAIPNWTGRMPTRGWPLMGLTALWLAGRLAVAGLIALGPVGVMVVDSAFMVAIGAMVTTQIVAGRNWSNLKIVVPVLLYLAANITFHLEAMAAGQADLGRRLGFAMVALLILLIGGRIIPSFTRNWLAKRGPGALPEPFGWFDAGSLGLSAVVLISW
ncbi:NnrS family protein, partial [Pseudotabrizicola sp.]